MPGVGNACPTEPGTTAAARAASGCPAVCAVPARGVAVTDGLVAAELDWLGALAGVCAAAGVSPAAAMAIAHPISLICTPVPVIGAHEARNCATGIWGLYKRGFPEPQAPAVLSVEGRVRAA